MKKSALLISTLLLVTIYYGCKKKDDDTTTSPTGAPAVDNYASLAQFHSQNGVPLQTYTIDAATGGSFTTPQGTVVSVPTNAFITQGGLTVTGSVTIQFKDIYKKSDMLFADKPTQYYSGIPLKSGGEFFIKASKDGATLLMATGKHINVTQPLNGIQPDALMKPMTLQIDSTIHPTWAVNPDDSLHSDATSYVFSLYHYNSPVDSGSYCNSDNPNYFAAYTQTNLTLSDTTIGSSIASEMYLMFSNINSMVHVYASGFHSFQYSYAPLGLQCTAVAVGVKNGKLYSAFVPITITSNLTVSFTLTETTTSAFKAQVNALN